MESTGKREKGRRGTERTEGLKKIQKKLQKLQKTFEKPLDKQERKWYNKQAVAKDGTEGTESVPRCADGQ